MTNKKAFTLIELIAVLVILAILALIVTPLVLNIVKKARVSADKRSIDAYGRSIELAVADYLLDKGTFPISIEQLQVEYTGDKVECNTTTLREDGSVYLAECTVNEREVTGYTYGKEEETPTYDAYEVGDEVTYNNVNYYVIKDSDTSESTVTLLKAEPLTVEEVNLYGGVGTENNHINKFTDISQNTVYNQNNYGAMQYYSSSTCGYNGEDWVNEGCTTNYNQSEIKYVVDTWKSNQAPSAIEARLIVLDDLKDNLGYVLDTEATSEEYKPGEKTPSWVYGNYNYCTSTPWNDSMNGLWYIRSGDGVMNTLLEVSSFGVVRPVIVIFKSAL